MYNENQRLCAASLYSIIQTLTYLLIIIKSIIQCTFRIHFSNLVTLFLLFILFFMFFV
ncbi:hypothetical protein Hanom_Chr17g01544351 [Helianthus anomalus]